MHDRPEMFNNKDYCNLEGKATFELELESHGGTWMKESFTENITDKDKEISLGTSGMHKCRFCRALLSLQGREGHTPRSSPHTFFGNQAVVHKQ